jgi:hypothetical protein
MKRAYSVKNVIDAKFKVLPFAGKWKDAIGCPEFCGTWIVFGDIKNGKTSFTMELTKYLTNWGRVLFNAVEEGLSLSIQEAYIRCNMGEVNGKFIMIANESVQELRERLLMHKSPQVVVIDTVQFWGIKYSEYKKLKAEFPNKLFIYVSHTEGKKPDGKVAQQIWRDANVAFRIEGFRAFPVGRYGGGEYIDISAEKANEYWGLTT